MNKDQLYLQRACGLAPGGANTAGTPQDVAGMDYPAASAHSSGTCNKPQGSLGAHLSVSRIAPSHSDVFWG